MSLSKQKLLKVEAVQSVLGCSRGQSYALVKSGEIPSIKVGGMIRIPQSFLDDYLASCTQQAKPGTNAAIDRELQERLRPQRKRPAKRKAKKAKCKAKKANRGAASRS